MRRPRPGGDKRQLWPGTQLLYSVHTAQEPNDCFPQERSFKRLKFVAHERLQTAISGHDKLSLTTKLAGGSVAQDRPGEIMVPWEGMCLPGWEPKIPLITGFKALADA